MTSTTEEDEELRKGFEGTYFGISREPITNPRDLIGKNSLLGGILGAIYKTIPVITVYGCKGIGKTSILRVIETLFTNNSELENLFKKLKPPFAKNLEEFRKRTPYPFYISVHRIGQKTLVTELMRSIFEKAKVDPRLKDVISSLVRYLKGIKKVKVGLEGVELEKDVSRVAMDEPFETLRRVCIETRKKFPAGVLILLDDADSLAIPVLRPFREALFRFLENNRGLCQFIISLYFDKEYLEPLKYITEFMIPKMTKKNALLLVRKFLPDIDEKDALKIAEEASFIPLYIRSVCAAIIKDSVYDKGKLRSYVKEGYEAVVEELDQELRNFLTFLDTSEDLQTAKELEVKYSKGRSSVYNYLKLLTYFEFIQKTNEHPARYSLNPYLRKFSK